MPSAAAWHDVGLPGQRFKTRSCQFQRRPVARLLPRGAPVEREREWEGFRERLGAFPCPPPGNLRG